MTKTLDGKFRVEEIVKRVRLLPNVSVVFNSGGDHNYLLKYSQAPIGNCALGKTTHTDYHLVPWLKKATGLSKNQIYQGLKGGSWN